jgi:peptidylprolyl isomerase
MRASDGTGPPPTLPRVRRLLILLCCFPILALAACGGGDEQEAASTPAPAETPAATETAAPDLSKLFAGISKDLSQKPVVPKPEGTPPAELVTKDIVRGKGPAAKPGDQISVQYVGVSWSTGQQFDASWDRGREPFSFVLGSGSVIAGWDQGLVGMKAGGRRVLVIPPQMGYGDMGAPPDIAPNETLIFVVDLEKIGG